MTVVDERAIGPNVLEARRAEVEIDLTAFWENTWLVRARGAGVPLFTCLAARPTPDLCVLQECLPRRRDPRLADILVAVAGRVRSELGTAEVVAMHPPSWDEPLAARGAARLHRMVHLGMLLEDDQLRLHHRPLPDGHTVVPLHGVSDVELSYLSTDRDRPHDLAVWREVLAGAYGPVIDEASVVISTGSGVCAAVAVTDYRGQPLIGHCVTGETHRGQGFGRAVLVEGLRRLVSAGYAECHLYVAEDNWIAHRCYRSIGFVPMRPPLRVSRIPDGGADDAR